MSKMLKVGGVIAALVVVSASTSRAAFITLNALNNSTTALISANDGAGDSYTSEDTFVSQYNMTYSDSGSPVTFNTFCIDLFNTATVGQQYDVDLRTDLSTAFVNGSRMDQIYQTYGEADLSSDPVQAAAVQIAEWDLSLNNHDPVSFVADTDGTYSSGDENVFSISLGSNPSAPVIAALVNTYLVGSIGVTTQGDWLDASAAGSATDRGQSVLYPPVVPEPSSVAILLAAGAGLSARRRRA